MRVLPRILPACAAAALLLAGCSSVRATYRRPGYAPASEQAVKHVVVAAWAPAEQPGLAATLAKVAADLVSLRKNYLVHASHPLTGGWDAACGELQGVLSVEVLGVDVQEDAVALDLAVELHRCADGALLWRAEAAASVDPADADLQELAGTYAAQLGEEARRFAAPAFVILQEIVRELPNPTLTEEEELEKIELG